MKSLVELRKMDSSALGLILLKAKEEFNKTLLLVGAKKEANTSKLSKVRKYVAQILTVRNKINNK